MKMDIDVYKRQLVFTTHGNYLHIPVHILPDLKWKDMPKHVSNVIETSPEESFVIAIPVSYTHL